MGFLKFLKREKKENFDELDLPPAPPPFGGFDEDMPELPEFPELEKISAPEEMREMPQFEIPEEKPGSEEETMQEFPAFPEMEEEPRDFIQSKSAVIPETVPSRPMPVPKAPEEEQPMPTDIYPRMERRLFAHEKRLLRERPSAKTIYIRVDNFKAALGSINIVRSDLRKSEEALAKLENMKNAKDKSLDKMKSSLDDLQKKLIFIDKTLFEGGE